MFYKVNNIMRYTFFVGGIVCLMSSTALSQNALSASGEAKTAPNVKIAIEQSADGDELFPANEYAANGINNNASQANQNSIARADAPVSLPSNSEVTVPTGPQFVNPQPPVKAGVVSPSTENKTQNAAEGQSVVEEENPAIKAYNEFVDAADRKAVNSPIAVDDNSAFSDKIMDQVKEDLFSQMADIEKQTGLLTLELKREKIKNEIAAMKAQRQKAIDEEQEKERERARKQAEWEKEQERLLLAEQRKLEEVKIRYERLRQERVLKAYKENMLKSNQDWVDYNTRLYNQLVKEENAQNEIMKKQKEFFANILSAANQAGTAAEAAKEKYSKEISNLQTQISVLKAKLEAEKARREQAMTGTKDGASGGKVDVDINPFALIDDESTPKKKIAEEYAIMEISGKGDALVAKLINKKGGTFMVKPGTILNTGHIIEEITQTYIITDRGGVKDYLYFSAGGILDKEPTDPITEDSASKTRSEASMKAPDLKSDMYVE